MWANDDNIFFVEDLVSNVVNESDTLLHTTEAAGATDREPGRGGRGGRGQKRSRGKGRGQGAPNRGGKAERSNTKPSGKGKERDDSESHVDHPLPEVAPAQPLAPVASTSHHHLTTTQDPQQLNQGNYLQQHEFAGYHGGYDRYDAPAMCEWIRVGLL